MLTRDVSKNPLNEHLNADGTIRPVYQSLMNSLNGLGVPELRQRWRDANDSRAIASYRVWHNKPRKVLLSKM